MSSILIVTNRAPWPLQDGGALAMHQLIQGYKREGWTVYLLCMNTARHFVEEDVLREQYAGIDSLIAVPFDNKLRAGRLLRNLLSSSQPEHAGRFYESGFEAVLLEAVGRLNPNAIQFESLFLTGYVPALRRVTSAPILLRMHNVEHQIWARAATAAKGAKGLYLRVLARRMKSYELESWSQYDILLPITGSDAASVRDSGCTTPLHLTPYGIGVEAADNYSGNPFINTLDEGASDFHRLYHLGAMDWIPNREAVAWFIQNAWPAVHAAVPEASFHFAGRNLEKSFAAPLYDGVQNHGTVADASAFLANKKTLVVPLQAGGGIRVKILEAMAAGKLVISTRVGMQGIDAIPGVHFLQADIAEEFASAARWAADHPENARSVVSAAFVLVKTVYDAQKIVAQLSKRVQRLLRETR